MPALSTEQVAGVLVQGVQLGFLSLGGIQEQDKEEDGLAASVALMPPSS
jgi:hypothetical protein